MRVIKEGVGVQFGLCNQLVFIAYKQNAPQIDQYAKSLHNKGKPANASI
jgi:hypothetical protein